MSLVITPPSVLDAGDSGVTSSSSTSLTSPLSTPPWIAAPTATASSGLTSLRGSLPKNSFTLSWTLGIRVWPPTGITSDTSESFDAGVLDRHPARLDRPLDQLFADERLDWRGVMLHRECFGPDWSAVMYGRLISVCCDDDSSIFAFSAES